MSKIKERIKNITPENLISLRRKMRARQSFNYDRKRFYAHSDNNTQKSQTNILARLIFYTHQIEKGLSHQDIRLGFGQSAFQNLAKVMPLVKDRSDLAYINALSAIRAYFTLHEKRNFDITDKKTILGKRIVREVEATKSTIGGKYELSAKDKQNNDKKTFSKLFTERASIREFSDQPVSHTKLHNAVKIAAKTPSVCNRQAYRVTYIYNTEKIASTLKLQGGFGGYAMPPVLALITTDLGCFLSNGERNQPFIDGGLFLMSFLLCLENEGLAACTLNAMFLPQKDQQIREIIGVKPNEVMIAFVAIGNFCDKNYAAKSFRYPSSHFIHEIN